MERESEIRYPLIVENNYLSAYKIILAPRPIPLPTNREIRDARRCMKSGMVPGAIRKYLMQKKKNEADDDDEGSGSAAPSPETINNNNNNISDDNDDDDIEIIAEFSPNAENNNVNVLAEVNTDRVPMQPSAPPSFSGQLGQDEENLENNTLDSDSDVASACNKRTFTEAFSLSPDSTTPDQIPEKRQRLETTPSPNTRKRDSNARRRTASASNASIPEESESVNASGINSGPCPAACVRRILQQDIISVTVGPEDEYLEKLIKKNDWKTVIDTFQTKLGQNKPCVPFPRYIGDMIRKAILCLGTRVPKDIPALAVEFFQSLAKAYPVRCDEESNKYYKAAFTQSSAGSSSMSTFIFTVLETIHADVKAKVPPKALPFFKGLTKMVINQYKEYQQPSVKVRRPFFVRFLEDDLRVFSYNMHCQRLVCNMFQLKDFPDEFKAVMRWVGLLSFHLRFHLYDNFKKLVLDFVDTVSKPEYAATKCSIIQAISDKPLGKAVCFNLLRKKIIFESTKSSSYPTDEDIESFLTAISKSEMISGLKVGLQERRRSVDLGPPLVSPLLVGKKAKQEGVNMKGETFLHKLCGKNSGDKKKDQARSLLLDKYLKEKHFSVNPTDNFGNTPLHDVIAHERFDALCKFAEHCSNASQPENFRVNLLSQNLAGNTPIHLGAASPACNEMVPLLIGIAENLQVTEEVLKILNQEGNMAFQLAFTPESRQLLKPPNIKDYIFEVGSVRIHSSSRVEFQKLEIKRLVILWSEFAMDGMDD